jgi:integrase
MARIFFTVKATSTTRKHQKLVHVGDCLYRSSRTDVYYAIFQREGRQVKRSLKTTDPELAKRRREIHRQKVERLTSDSAKLLPFAEYDKNKPTELIGGLAKRWVDIAGGTMEPSSRDRMLGVIRNLNRHLGGFTVRNVTLRSLEQWATARRNACSAHTFNYELETLRRILDYAVEHGILMENPAHKIKRCKPHKKPVAIPTKDQFRKMLDEMHAKGSQDSADLAELLAYSGCRKGELVGDAKYSKPPMFWRDVDFELKVFTVTRSKNHEPRTVPLFPAMENFLCELQSRRQDPTNTNERIIPIYSAKTAITSACKATNLPHFHHHSLRHFFCSNAIEAGVDFKTIAGWLGHKDGGVLVARTYGHLRNEHSAAMAKRMSWGASTTEPENVVPMTARK